MSSNTPPPAAEQLFAPGELEADLFWEKHRKTILIAVAAVLVVLALVTLWLINAHNTRLAAAAAFAEAGSPEAWREVMARYPSSPQAADAYFLLAESQREQGDIGGSNETYRKFLTVFPEHALAGGARLGLAENLAAEGKSAEALAALREVQVLNAGSYAASYAALLEGRMALREGRVAEARKIFSNLVATDSTSPAARVAGAQLDELVPILPPEPVAP